MDGSQDEGNGEVVHVPDDCLTPCPTVPRTFPTTTTEKKDLSLYCNGRWSVEENGALDGSMFPTLPMTNGHHSPTTSSVSLNNGHAESPSPLNNNLIGNDCESDKGLCLYRKLPPKLNNNADGMNDYLHSWGGIEDSLPDQMNALNGDDDDNDAIYSYKGEGYESNLGHLMDSCLSCGLPNPMRGRVPPLMPHMMNGHGSHHQNNLFSPDMDFLEMDFDPGSNGPGDLPESDCEDNCALDGLPGLPHPRMHIGGNSPDLTKETNTELGRLMCQRCETSLGDTKVSNTPNGVPPRGNLALNLDPQDCPSHSNVSQGSPNTSGEIENNVMAAVEVGDDDGDSIENNLAEDDSGPESEYFNSGDEADDEGGDSVCEPALQQPSLLVPSVMNNLLVTSSNNGLDPLHNLASSYDTKSDQTKCHHTGSSTCHMIATPLNSCSSECAHSVSNDECNSNNNNLGSSSAPEVSPAQEYGPLGRLSRSLSFHNQLSFPKYQNTCSQRNDDVNEGRYPLCCSSSGEPNIQACRHRLTQRENSVFNILADSNQYQVIKTASCRSPPLSPSCSSPAPPLTSQSPLYSPNLLSPSHCSPLHNKSLQLKVDNLAQDPNTASTDDGAPQGNMGKTMIWTERQATLRQWSQVGTSACGATACVNALLALGMAAPVDKVRSAVHTALRAETAPLVHYLRSRGVAGCTHDHLINGVKSLTEDRVAARFFHMFPKRAIQLTRWLAMWIQKGGVPVATLNRQVGVAPGETIPDSWHHQMIFGVGPQGVYLTNPLECVSDSLLGEQLCSDSVLLVRRQDIVSRWSRQDSLLDLTTIEDDRWRDMNVLGEVVGVLKEETAPPMMQGRRHLTSHVVIPASYKSGITIFMRKDNLNVDSLIEAGDLPFLE